MAQAGSDATIPWRSPTLHVILAGSLLGVMGVSLISPVLPTMRAALAISEAEASLVLTAYTLPGIVLAPAIGILADRFGRRRVLVPALLVFGLSGSLVVTTTDYPLILGLRVIQGSAGSGLISLAVTLIGDHYDGDRRNTLMGINGAVISVGAATYPLIGGALASLIWTAPFAFYGVGVLVGVFALRVLEEPAVERGARGLEYLRGALDVVPAREAAALYGASVAIMIVNYGALLTALPFYLSEAFSLSAVAIGGVLAASSLTTAVVASQTGRLARRVPIPRLIALGFVSYGVGLIGIWAAPSPELTVGAILFFGAGQGLTMPSTDVAVSQLAPGRYRGGVMSLRTSTLRLGQTIGPPVFTSAAVVFGYPALLFGTGVVVLLAGGLASLLLRP